MFSTVSALNFIQKSLNFVLSSISMADPKFESRDIMPVCGRRPWRDPHRGMRLSCLTPARCRCISLTAAPTRSTNPNWCHQRSTPDDPDDGDDPDDLDDPDDPGDPDDPHDPDDPAAAAPPSAARCCLSGCAWRRRRRGPSRAWRTKIRPQRARLSARTT